MGLSLYRTVLRPLQRAGHPVKCIHLRFSFLVVCFVLFCCFAFGGGGAALHLQHMEVPRLVVESELQLLAYTTVTVMKDPSHIYDTHHSSWQRRILNPLSEPRDQTRILIDTSLICFCCTTMGTPFIVFFNCFLRQHFVGYTFHQMVPGVIFGDFLSVSEGNFKA